MQPDTVTANKVVSLTYVIRKQDGEIFEYTDLPIDYVHGMNSKLFRKVKPLFLTVEECVVRSLRRIPLFTKSAPNLKFLLLVRRTISDNEQGRTRKSREDREAQIGARVAI